nr:MAG TPA: hypothetical protein [Caudoviricetes sp.]
MKVFLSSSKPYGIPDLKVDEFPVKELIPTGLIVSE